MIELERVSQSNSGVSEWYTFKHNDTSYQLIRFEDQSLFWLSKICKKRQNTSMFTSHSYNKKLGWLKTANYNTGKTFHEQVSLEEAKLIIELDIL